MTASARSGRLVAGCLLPACMASAHATTAPVAASADAASASGSVLAEMMGILFPLAVVVLLLLAVLWMVRRRFGLSSRHASLSIVQVLPLGPRERMVMVRTRAGRVLALGVSAQSVSLITELDPDDVLAPAVDDAPSDAAAQEPAPAANQHWAMALARRMQRR